ncbi:uncharacterized protein M6B38_124355 [Iris pallida]|uniref:BAH domain-containing protein n=1 Tax=Iris pallida TaxID=29817 RepID=A0AAX6H3G5_IRIPA|nr:uncharacterized protein M6B38_124355 [Iris pallida]
MAQRPFEQIPTIEEEEEEEQAMAEQEEEEEPEEAEEGFEQEEDDEEPAKPMGTVIEYSGTGAERRKHYRSFIYDERIFELGQTVLLTPDVIGKPYVAIIKEITEDTDGKLWVRGQWFYRPEDVYVEGDNCWKSRDSRDLFYSFHCDEVPAESVMHECVIHFVPLHKKLPIRAQHPGFIVQKLYDYGQKKVLDLVGGDYDKQKRNDIDLFFEKTRERLGELPDLLTEDSSAQKDDCLKSKKNLGRTSKPQVSGVDPTTRFDQLEKAYSPGSSVTDVSKYHAILSKFRVLTGDPHRDKWLEKLLHGSQLVCSSKEVLPTKDSGSYSAISDVNFKIHWPDEAIPIIATLERVTYEAMGVDFQKYNQKMRKLDFNLKAGKHILLIV